MDSRYRYYIISLRDEYDSFYNFNRLKKDQMNIIVRYTIPILWAEGQWHYYTYDNRWDDIKFISEMGDWMERRWSNNEVDVKEIAPEYFELLQVYNKK